MASTRKSSTVRVVAKRDHFNLSTTLAVSICGLLVSLIGTGIAQVFTMGGSVATLSSKVATLADAQTRVEKQLEKHLDNTVDKADYQRRDQAIQRQLNDKANKDELTDVREQFKDTVKDLKETIRAIQDGFAVRHR